MNDGTIENYRPAIDRHITQGTRGETGHPWCERIWTAIATCHQQGVSAFHFIRDVVQAYFTASNAPLFARGVTLYK